MAVASALVLVALPVAAQSQWQLASHPVATDAPHINSTQINFGGHEWVVIGNGSKDIYSDGSTYGGAAADPNSVTLLSRNDDAGGYFGSGVVFRANGSSCYGAYAGNCQNYPNEYKDSNLQGQMAGIATALPGKERDVINPRDLVPILGALPSNLNALKENDGMNGWSVDNQLLWALSLAEWEAIADDDLRKYPSSWWLRSPGLLFNYALAGGSGGNHRSDLDVDNPSYVVRPAFNLNLTSVLFTSESSNTPGATKFGAAAGGAYRTAAQPTTGARKFTFLDPGIATPTLILNATPLAFTLAAAPLLDPANLLPGAAQYVSGFLTNGTADYYAQYVDTTSVPTGSFNAATLTGFPTTNGNYILHIFSEEANNYLYSDFASKSVDFTFDVASGSVQNLTLTSNSSFGLDGGTIGLLDSGSLTYSQPWTLGAGGGTLAVPNGVSAKISGVVSGGNGNLTKDGAGTLILSGTNNYNGGTTVSAGTLAGNIAANTNLTVESNATYDGTGAARTVNVLSGAGSITNEDGLTVQSVTFSGIISGAGSLTKNGTGKLTLSSNNTYTGSTGIAAGGTLEITGTLGYGAGLGNINEYTGDITNAGTLIFNQYANHTNLLSII
ncbi:hypothetical protein AGMMS50256_33050 [Betaproteobacteria bacterium]|nr:hypothetical protein AGMMS50256_33050 [Betaproteobacteria bacterium]